MRKHVFTLVFVVGCAALGGCGSSLPEVLFDASLSSAKESIESAVDEAVGGLVGELADFNTTAPDEEQPNG